MERLGREIERELSRSGGGHVLALAEITSVWPSAVGEAVARQAWPLRLARDGTLHVATSSATWAFELDRLAGEICQRLEALLGSASPGRLRFRVGPVPEPGASGRPTHAVVDAVDDSPRQPSPEATAVASAIGDAELRDLVARAAQASLDRARRLPRRDP
jgi:hypothetical protein